ncbi:MAG: SIMPL domain-containing protein [Bdellovibrionota bacterium]
MRFLPQIIIALTIAFSAFLIGKGLEHFNRDERIISVRGLAEKEVEANIAVWKITFNVSSDKIDDVRTQLPAAQGNIQDFLIKAGFDLKEISKDSNIRDRQAQEYGEGKGNRFVATGIYTIKTAQVKKVEEAVQSLDELLRKGVVITASTKSFYFTNLNEIKPAMLDEATKNAKEAAEGFAKSMNVNVGKLKSASQGVFTIENAIGNGGYSEGDSSIDKKIRVVTQVDFYIN